MTRGYKRDVEPRLEEISQWAAAGVSEKNIAGNLGISLTSLKTWKKANPPLLAALTKGSKDLVPTVVGAMMRRATGYDADELVQEYAFDEDGNRILVKEKHSKRHIPGDANLIEFILCNRAPEEWRKAQEIRTSLDVGGRPIKSLDLTTLTDEELERLAAGKTADGDG